MTTYGFQISQRGCWDLLLGVNGRHLGCSPCCGTWCPILREGGVLEGKGLLVVLLLSPDHLLCRVKINECKQYFGLHKSIFYLLAESGFLVSPEERLLPNRRRRWSLRVAHVCELHVASSDERQLQRANGTWARGEERATIPAAVVQSRELSQAAGLAHGPRFWEGVTHLLAAVCYWQKDLPYAIQYNQGWGQTVAQPNFVWTPL